MSVAIGTRVGPYEIEAAIGAGGMGEVYRARDIRLGRTAAVKVLPDSLATDPERRERFAREARTVASLNHPNIVTIYGVEEAAGASFLAMELVEGQPLSALIPSRGLPTGRLLALSIQLADAVSAAHERGIVHRDLKPANVMVTGEGRVKVLDFGLARLKEEGQSAARTTVVGDSAITAEGRVVGTVAYMSPEQAEGKPVDHRTDIFSLGIVLYEMATGERPFKGESSLAVLSAIVKDAPGSVTALNPSLPRDVARIVKRCLAKDPEQRYQSAKDLRNDLQELQRDVESGEAPASRDVPSRTERRPGWLVPVGAVAILVILAVVFGGRRLLAPGPVRPAQSGQAAEPVAPKLDPTRIAVARFTNATGDPSLDTFGAMAAEWITQGLSQLPAIDAVPASGGLLAGGPVSRTTPGPGQDPVRVLARDTGAGTVVNGSYYRQGDNLRVQASIVDARDGKLLAAIEPATVERPERGDMSSLEPLRQRVLGAIALRFDPTWSAMDVQRRAPQYEAYREYVAGLELFGKDYAGAIRHFQKSSEIDPGFFAPQLYIAVAHGNQADASLAGERHMAEAVAITARLNENRERWTLEERLLLDWYRADTAGRYEEALRLLRELERLVPRNYMVKYLVGLLEARVNRPGVTVQVLGKLEPPEWALRRVAGSWAFDVLAKAYHCLGDYQKELETAKRERERYRDLPGSRVNEVRALAALGRVEEVTRVVTDALALPGEAPGTVMADAAEELRAHGNRGASLVIAGRAVEWHRARTQTATGEEARAAFARALYRAERWDEARIAFAKLSAAQPRTVEYQGYLGTLAARAGRRDEALRISDALARLDRPHLLGENTYWRAAIAALVGDGDKAVTLLQQSFNEGNYYGVYLHRDMDFETVRQQAPFQALLRPKE